MAQSPLVLEATDQNFEKDVLAGAQLSLVDFWAEWCGPCKPLGQTIDALAGEFAGQVRMFKLNVEHNPEMATRFRVRGLPTVILFKNGEIVDQIAGNLPKDVLAQAIARHLA